MCMCVSVPQASNCYSREMEPESGENSYTAFRFLYTAPTINIANGRGRSSEALQF